MRIDILTLFPEMFEGFLQTSILKRALKKELLEIKLWDLRKYGKGPHRQVDDRPYGGGAGMVLRVDIIDRALRDLKLRTKKEKGKTKTILLTPSGKIFTQQKSLSLSCFSRPPCKPARRCGQARLPDALSRQAIGGQANLILVCGHYEGFDERVRQLVDEEISIGDYVLTGGELPAMVVVDAVCRHIPGVLGKKESLVEESFSISDPRSQILLEYPHYTRPEDYKGQKVPKILLSGNHTQIKKWRMDEALKKTKKIRPDLLINIS